MIPRHNPRQPTVPHDLHMVVEATIFHWVEVVVPTKDGTEGLGVSIQNLVAYL